VIANASTTFHVLRALPDVRRESQADPRCRYTHLVYQPRSPFEPAEAFVRGQGPHTILRVDELLVLGHAVRDLGTSGQPGELKSCLPIHHSAALRPDITDDTRSGMRHPLSLELRTPSGRGKTVGFRYPSLKRRVANSGTTAASVSDASLVWSFPGRHMALSSRRPCVPDRQRGPH
jgi:hypothetical protein